MKCQKCDNYQESGKFCGKCGGAMIELAVEEKEQFMRAQEEAVATNDQVSKGISNQSESNEIPNEHIEQVKEKTKAYWSYYLRFLKRPSAIYKETDQFINGLISLILIGLITSVIGITNIPRDAYFYLGTSSIEVFIGAFLAVEVPIVIVALSLFLILKFFGKALSFKQIISVYGAQSLLAVTLVAGAFLLSLINSYTYSGLFLSLAIIIVFIIVPAFIVIRLLIENARGIDPLYGYMLYLVLFTIITSIVFSILLDSMIGQIVEIFGGVFNF